LVYCTVMCAKNFTSGSILLKKSYWRFEFQVKNSLDWIVQLDNKKLKDCPPPGVEPGHSGSIPGGGQTFNFLLSSSTI
jgi:hypothetical protein